MSDITIIYLLIGAAVVFFLWLRSFIRRNGQNFPNLQHAFGVRKQHGQTDDHNPHNYVLPAAIATGYVVGNQAQSAENPASSEVGASSDSPSSSDSGSSGGDSGGGGGGDGGGGDGGGD